MNRKLILCLMLGIFLIGIISAQVSYCCERLIDNGPWCVEASETECDPNYLSVPTSCEATSYCKLGVCIDTEEGNCFKNTPNRVCVDPNGDGDTSDGGKWDEREKEDIPQCQLGCCLIGEQAAFTTLTRCKTLSSRYSLTINWRKDIQSEASCILLSTSNAKGACVFEEEYQKNCKITTRTECADMEVGDSSTDFYEGYLCSADQLETVCGRTKDTTCVDGKDEVYLLDGCGNVANVYDADRIDEDDYWEKMVVPSCSVDLNVGSSDPNSPEKCGNCDYYSGSTCKRAERGESADYGNYVCADLGCRYDGEDYEHGETWCADSGGIENSLPGSRHFRMVCYNGEVTVEPCADFRQEICIQTAIESREGVSFKTANCVVNKWQDCYAQDNEKDCENFNQRDCRWLKSVSIFRKDLCVPLSAPGFNFWEGGTDAGEVCGLASQTCYVEYEGLLGDQISGKKGKAKWDWKCMDDCRASAEECLFNFDDPLGLCKSKCQEQCPVKCVDENGEIKDNWREEMKNLCSSMGDCGSSVNYDGREGYYEIEDLLTKSGIEGEE